MLIKPGLISTIILFTSFFQTSKISAQIQGELVIPKSHELTGCTYYVSKTGKYILTRGLGEDYVLWDSKSGKQFASIVPKATASEYPMAYNAQPVFSDDEKLVMIPVQPNGRFLLYDIIKAKVLKEFTPPGKSYKYTHAFFAPDSRSILLVKHQFKEKQNSYLDFFSIEGEQLGTSIVYMNQDMNNPDFMIKRSKERLAMTMEVYPASHCFAVSTDFKRFACANFDGTVYSGDLSKHGTIHPKVILQTTTNYFRSMRLYENMVVLKFGFNLSKKDSKSYYVRDSIVLVDIPSKRVIKNIYIKIPKPSQSTIKAPMPSTVFSSDLYSYVDAKFLPDSTISYVIKDVINDRQLGSYIWNRNAEYESDEFKPNILHGGFIVGLSADQRFLVEHAGQTIIHDLKSKTIYNNFTLINTVLKLNAASFIDSNHIFISKNYNDGYILSLNDGRVKRLRSTVECLDTLKSGIMNFAGRDNFSTLGLRNYNISADGSKIITGDYNTNVYCGLPNQKTFRLTDWKKDTILKSFKAIIPNYTNQIDFVGNDFDKYLVSNYIVDLGNPAQLVELKIKERRTEFHCFHPKYSASSKSIYGLASTIETNGSPDIYLANWDLNGKLIKSVKIGSKRNSYEFQEMISSSRISKDGKYLLATGFYGWIRIYDLQTMKLYQQWEYGIQYPGLGWFLDKHDNVIDACFSSNEDRIAAAGNDGVIRIYSIGKPDAVREIKVDTRVVYSLSFSMDDEWLLVSCADNSLRVFETATGKLLFYFMAFADDKYAIINSEGYYLTNKQALDGLAFYLDGKVFDYSQFDMRFNRPDKVLATIGRSSPQTIQAFRNAYNKRLKLSGLDPDIVPGKYWVASPELEVLRNDTLGVETTKNFYSFKVKSNDVVHGLKSLNVNVNGVPLYGAKGYRFAKATTVIDLPIVIPLSAGRNRIQVSVLNSKGISSAFETFTINFRKPASKPDLYVIAIGSGRYQDPKNNLAYAVKDATDITKLFQSFSGKYSKIYTWLLTDERVTIANIIAIRKSLARSNPDDQVILFYAGHGLKTDADYFLTTYTTDFAKPEKGSISFQVIENLLDSIPARTKTCFIDACHSGEIDRDNKQSKLQTVFVNPEVQFRGTAPDNGPISAATDESLELMKQIFGDTRTQTGSNIIASAGGYQYAYESGNWNNGVFTFSILSGLKDRMADLNGDGKILLSELQKYVAEKVLKLTNGLQRPTVRAENLAADYQVN